jgi:hypothetical protein
LTTDTEYDPKGAEEIRGLYPGGAKGNSSIQPGPAEITSMRRSDESLWQ